MARYWIVFFIIVAVAEATSRSKTLEDYEREFPLTKSLGLSVKKKTLEEAQLSQEYMEQYHEMLRASQESFETFDEDEVKRLGKIVGKDNLKSMKEGVVDKRRSVSRLRSAIGRRRARSQAVRRDKLNSQSLRSHLEHTRLSGRENLYGPPSYIY